VPFGAPFLKESMSSSVLPPFEFVLNVMDEAGLTPTEMIKLLPINRATFYNWKRGERVADLLRYRLTIARCGKIRKATEQGRLPLSEDVPRPSRMTAILSILKDVG
jgi:hypothetical protein